MKRPTALAFLVLILAASCGTPSTPILPTHPPVPLDSPTPAATATETATPAPVLTPTLAAGATRTSPADGMVLVYIPAGDFPMGSADSDGQAYEIEKPQHTVTLDAFWIDRTEVTNGQYALCVQASACKIPRRVTSNVHDSYYTNPAFADFPVIWVNWNDARAFCQWAGERLLTEAEWEKASRGTDGRLYAWGNEPTDATRANFNQTVKDVARVGQYPQGTSFYGVLDMAGNVWEWTADWFDKGYYSQSPQANPAGPATGDRRVVRGGSYVYTAIAMRAAYRYSREPAAATSEIGFRCGMNAQP